MSGSPRVALVTGAARGIGQAIALRLAETGHALALADVLPADETVTTIKSAGGEAFAVICDLGSPTDIDLLVREVTGHYGRCDVLVNCVALMLMRPFGELDLDTWRHVQAVNVGARARKKGNTAEHFGRVHDHWPGHPDRRRPGHLVAGRGGRIRKATGRW